jgi:5-methylcytosine-specific restriction endonuclease McrA
VKLPCLKCGVLTHGSYCEKHRPRRARRVREKAFRAMPAKCFRCGAEGVPLEVDHINGDPEDNRLANLRPLCLPCHKLVTYGRD